MIKVERIGASREKRKVLMMERANSRTWAIRSGSGAWSEHKNAVKDKRAGNRDRQIPRRAERPRARLV